jgi:predicted nucleic acid-binding protein
VRVLVDTPVWSLALRRRAGDLNPAEERVAQELWELIQETRSQLIGPVRQELLSGIRDLAQYERLRQHLRAFPNETISLSDYELAARLNNRCRAAGIAGSAIDFLICAVGLERQWTIFTTDEDFRRYATVIPVRLHSVRPSE